MPASQTDTDAPARGPPAVLTVPDRVNVVTRLMSWVVAALTAIAVALAKLDPPNH